jgi:ribosomal protein S18 acetylase RimI-like enzyme
MNHNPIIRRASERDLDAIVDLLVRNKRLNEEFDPMLTVTDEIAEVARRYASEAMRDPNSLVLVCEEGGRVVGFLKADVIDRLFYEPRREGVIREFYLLPEFRRRGIGRTMIEKAMEELRSMGAGIITAEFPSQHKIAVSFYENLGFRPIISKYAKEVTR